MPRKFSDKSGDPGSGTASTYLPAVQSGGRITHRHLLAIVVFIVVFLPVLWVLVFQPYPTKVQEIITYACIALMAGIGFTLATASEGSVKLPHLGVSLGGGAAIGIAVLLLSVKLLGSTYPTIVLNPTNSNSESAVVESTSSNLRANRIEGTQRFLLEFSDSSSENTGRVSFLVATSEGTDKHEFKVSREGEVIPIGGGQ